MKTIVKTLHLILIAALVLQPVPAIEASAPGGAPGADMSTILQTIARYEKELGLTASAAAVFERGEGAVAFTSESILPSLASPDVQGKPSDTLKIRTLFDTASDTIKKKVLIRRGTFRAGFTTTLENKGRPFTQRTLNKEGGDSYLFEREGEAFFYSQATGKNGEIQLKEWVYAGKPQSKEGSNYEWHFENADTARMLSLRNNSDGSVSVLQSATAVRGLPAQDSSRRKHVMDVVSQVLGGLAAASENEEIGRLDPAVYWTANGVKKCAQFVIENETHLKIAVHEPAEAYPLLIDPTLNWGQLISGGGLGTSSKVVAIAVDASTQEIYAVGHAGNSAGMPAVTVQGAYSGGSEIFVLEIADGTTPTLNWGQWLGGSGTDMATSVAVAGDEIYVGGYTTSNTSWESVTFQGSVGGGNEGFVIEIADGTTPTLNWGQWLGGAGTDPVYAIAVDADEIYAAGESSDATSWETVTFQGTHSGGGTEGFVIEIADGATPTLNWGQWLGGTGADGVTALAVNGDEIYAAGASSSTTSWETVTFQGALAGTEGFVIEIADGTTPTLNWGQWLGGTSTEIINTVVVTGDEIYAGGYAANATTWETVTFQGTHSGGNEGFVIEIADGATPTLNWGQWLGGTGTDTVLSLAVNGDEIYVAGHTADTTSWETVTFQGAQSGTEGFVIEIADGASPTLNWGQWLGGTGTDYAMALAVDGDEIYATGYSTSDSTWESVTFQGTFNSTYLDCGYAVEIADGASPTLNWGQWAGSTYGAFNANAVAVDGASIYVAGTASGGLVLNYTFQGTVTPVSSGADAFVVKIVDGTTPNFVWGQYLGGDQAESVYGIAAAGGEIYVVGNSFSSTGWETVTFQGTFGGTTDAYVVEIADGTTPTLNWGQWLGGSSSDEADSVAINGDEIYVGGKSSGSASWETVTFQGTFAGSQEAWVIEIADGTTPTLNWGQWLGGSGTSEYTLALAVNGDEIYAGGMSASSSTWDVTMQGAYSGTQEGWVIEIADGATPTLNWGQFLGGTSSTAVYDLAVNGDEIYVGGTTGNATTWETVTFQGTHSGGNEGFVIEIADGATPTLNWGQWLGGTGADSVNALAVNGDEIYVGGYSDSSASWESVTFQGTFTGTNDAWVIEIADGASPTLNWATWLGGAGTEDFTYGNGIAVNGDKVYYCSKSVASQGFDETVTFQGTDTVGTDAFLVRIDDDGITSGTDGKFFALF